jgi:hypothetical protein
MAEKMKEVKQDESIDPTDRLKVIAEMWSNLGDDGKAEWCEEHGYPAPKSPTKKATPKQSETDKPKRKAPAKKKTDPSDEEASEKPDEPEVDEALPEELVVAPPPLPEKTDD